MTDDFVRIAKMANKLASELDGRAANKRLREVGGVLKREIPAAVSSDIKHPYMSGWRRKAPIQIVGRAVPISNHEVVVKPVKKAIGPMVVLEQGRHRGQIAGAHGPGVNRKTGLTTRTKTGKIRKVAGWAPRRWNGYTQPKHTWTHTEIRIRAKAPRVVYDKWVYYILKHYAGRGRRNQ